MIKIIKKYRIKIKGNLLVSLPPSMGSSFLPVKKNQLNLKAYFIKLNMIDPVSEISNYDDKTIHFSPFLKNFMTGNYLFFE